MVFLAKYSTLCEHSCRTNVMDTIKCAFPYDEFVENGLRTAGCKKVDPLKTANH